MTTIEQADYRAMEEIVITRAQLDALRAEVAALRAAIDEISRANGYGLDVPLDYGDDRSWIVTARAIRACQRARKFQSIIV